jgi:hypothetical protein
MSWKFVFNTGFKGWTFSEAMDMVKKTGYDFFIFNGYIYTRDGLQTNITSTDLF